MAADAVELADVQQELQSVRNALRDGTEHLGLGGERLAQYESQLSQKEKILSGGDDAAKAVASGGAQAPAKEPPAGPPRALDREDVAAVVSHLVDYEALVPECAKALKALSYLAYSSPAKVGGDERTLPQMLRLCALHPTEGPIHTAVVKVLCNIASDASLAMTKLTDPEILALLLTSIANGEQKDQTKGGEAALGGEAAAKAGEALVRMIAPEVNPKGAASQPDLATGPLAKIIVAAAGGQDAVVDVLPPLLKQMVLNEVCEFDKIAERFVAASAPAAGSAKTAIGWLNISKLLVSLSLEWGTPLNFHPILIAKGSILGAVQIMQAFPAEASVQIASMEATSCMVGDRMEALQAYVDAGGMKLVEGAMAAHSDQALLQTKGIRSLASGTRWSLDLKTKADYDAGRSIELTVKAMARHLDDVDCQRAGLGAFAAYYATGCKEALRGAGGEDVVKAAVTRYPDNKALRKEARTAFEGMGADPSWEPGSPVSDAL